MIKITTAAANKLISKTGFKNYDFCLNPYVGCQFGCTYCYVRFFVKDKEKQWGEFVRLRQHINKKLPKEILTIAGSRLVIGTMTDPYQPEERKHRLTRKALKIILDTPTPLQKVGIFTRSPIVLDDIDLIKKLPRARVHYTISPYDETTIKMVEPIPIRTTRRFDVVNELKKAGVHTHVNVAPAVPILSDPLTDDFMRQLSNIGVDEFFVDPMQAYDTSFVALMESIQNHPQSGEIYSIMTNDDAYQRWKDNYKQSWLTAWNKYKSTNPNTLPIWSDHENKVWRDMRTNQEMDHKNYGDDIA